MTTKVKREPTKQEEECFIRIYKELIDQAYTYPILFIRNDIPMVFMTDSLRTLNGDDWDIVMSLADCYSALNMEYPLDKQEVKRGEQNE